jgi:hypothetical protein
VQPSSTQEKAVKMSLVRRGWASAAFCAMGVMLSVPAPAAGLLDSVLSSKNDLGPATRREWRLDEFTQVRLVDKEAGAPANQQPAVVDPAALTARLAAIETTTTHENETLFAEDELAELTPVLVRALSLAKPTDDVLLLSTARRGGRFAAPKGLTARLFVQGDALQLIVHDARNDFLPAARHSRVTPKFEYGSRTRAGRNELRSAGASSKRKDWLSIPLASLAAGAAPAAAAPAAPAAPPAVRPVATAPAPAPAAAVPAAPPPVPGSPAAIGDEVEQRLTTLKRLRDKGLITEEEYQQKRREVLQRL